MKLLMWMILLPMIVTAKNVDNAVKYIPSINYMHCTTHDCVKDNLEFELAIWNNMNSNVDPCDNFYEFACGNIDKIPDDLVQNKQSSNVNDIIKTQMTNGDLINAELLLTQYRNNSDRFKLFNVLDDFLTSCENVNNNNDPSIPGVKEDKLNFLFDLISKLGDWPVIKGDTWNDTNFNWFDFSTKLKHTYMQLNHFIALQCDLEGKIELDSLETFGDKISYKDITNPTKINNYYYYMVNVAEYFGANETQAEIELMESLEFEKKLINLSHKNDTSGHRKMTIKELSKEWQNVDWLKFFNASAFPHTYFTNESIVTIKNLHYLTNLKQLLKETPKRVQANYAIWKIIEYWASFVPSISLSNIEQMYNKMNHPTYIHQRHNCFWYISTTLPDLMYAFYLRHNPMDQEIRSKIRQMVLDLKNKLLDSFNKSEWLDANTRDKLVEGINSLRIIIGYPDELMDDKKMTEYYQELVMTRDNLMGNILNLGKFMEKKVWHHRTTPEESADLLNILRVYSPFGGETFYSGEHHALSAAAMNNILFNPNHPHYVNLGIFGSIMSHEIGHAVFNIHRMFTDDKTIENGWSFTSNQKYNITETCLIDQYGKYLIEGTNQTLNGTLLLSENIADNIGTTLAYSAYRDWAKKHVAEITFPTLPYNSNQLFWLSTANLWCVSKSFIRAIDPQVNDSHAPFDKRVIVPMMNNPEFSKDFNCPLGSNMNPVNKCIFF